MDGTLGSQTAGCSTARACVITSGELLAETIREERGGVGR